MNAAASRVHAVIHAKVVAFLMTQYPAYTWAVDLDWYVGDERRLRVQPDIAGLKGDDLVVACEISATSFETDTNAKMALYKALKIPFYVVVDCYEKAAVAFELDGNGDYVRSAMFADVDGVVKRAFG